MSGRTFRSGKNKTLSAPTFSLHFNRADEEQIEFSYCDEQKKSETLKTVSTSETDSVIPNLNDKDPDGEGESQNLQSSLSSLSDFSNSSFLLDSNGDYDVPKTPWKSIEESKKFEEKSVLFEQNSQACAEHIETSVKKSEASPYLSSFHSESNKEESDAHAFSASPDISSLTGEVSNIVPLQSSHKTDIQSSGNKPKTVSRAIEKTFDFDSKTLRGLLERIFQIVDSARNNVKVHVFLAVCVCILGPFPSWISGFFVGIILSSSILYWLFKPNKRSKKPENCFFKLPENISKTSPETDDHRYQGWMNQLPDDMDYCPEKYHTSQTRSVFVRLEGSSLRLSFPAKNIPKRAMFNEPRFEMQFVCQKHYDMTGAKVQLIPKGLSKKRLWSKKYPLSLKIQSLKKSALSSPDDSENQSKGTKAQANNFDAVVIYLFSRTDRDKHVWFLRFLNASKLKINKPQNSLSLNNLNCNFSLDKRTKSIDFASLQFNASEANDEKEMGMDDFIEISLNKQDKFEMYMSHLLDPLKNLKKTGKSAGNYNSGNLTWLNTFMGRLFFDCFVEEEWTKLVTEKIQRKLDKLQLPFFLAELKVKEVNLGSSLPKFYQVSDPSVDERGMWINLDLSYDGSLLMTLETKLNLSKFRESSEGYWTPLADISSISADDLDHGAKSFIGSSDDDSTDSYSDSECESSVAAVSSDSSKASKSSRLMKFMDRLAQSSYVKSAAKNKYVKRAMDDLSRKPLLLTVEVQWLTGTLALNIPPWPTDRLWYGFQKNTSLSIAAHPKLGQHSVKLSHVTEWIEKKLISEFQKVLVLPNMDDLIIPIMKSDLEMDS